jgi:cytochrome P450
MTDDELWEDVHDVIGAGHETTANTLTAALWEVAAHADVDAKVCLTRALEGVEAAL